MAAMADAILQQLGACKSLLAAMRGHSGYGKASAAESQRAKVLLRMTALNTSDMGKIAGAIKDAGFAAEDEAALIDTLAEGIWERPAMQREFGGWHAGLHGVAESTSRHRCSQACGAVASQA